MIIWIYQYSQIFTIILLPTQYTPLYTCSSFIHSIIVFMNVQKKINFSVLLIAAIYCASLVPTIVIPAPNPYLNQCSALFRIIIPDIHLLMIEFIILQVTSKKNPATPLPPLRRRIGILSPARAIFFLPSIYRTLPLTTTPSGDITSSTMVPWPPPPKPSTPLTLSPLPLAVNFAPFLGET